MLYESTLCSREEWYLVIKGFTQTGMGMYASENVSGHSSSHIQTLLVVALEGVVRTSGGFPP